MIKFKPKQKIQLSTHFDSTEFDCVCGNCKENYVDQKLIDLLEEVREKFGEALTVTSGYRCPVHNKAVGGAVASQHVNGLAADIKPKSSTKEKLDKLYAICYDIFDNIGDGRPKGFIHVDVRPAKSSGKRTWIY
jgi:Uncharacterized protein conserved in bacteria